MSILLQKKIRDYFVPYTPPVIATLAPLIELPSHVPLTASSVTSVDAPLCSVTFIGCVLVAVVLVDVLSKLTPL